MRGRQSDENVACKIGACKGLFFLRVRTTFLSFSLQIIRVCCEGKPSVFSMWYVWLWVATPLPWVTQQHNQGHNRCPAHEVSHGYCCVFLKYSGHKKVELQRGFYSDQEPQSLMIWLGSNNCISGKRQISLIYLMVIFPDILFLGDLHLIWMLCQYMLFVEFSSTSI